MRRLPMMLLLCGGMLLPAARASAACDGTVERSGPVTIEVGSVQRMFVVRVPSGADGHMAAPVMFVFHPFGMNAQYMQSRVPGRVWPEAIMLYPEGLSRAGGGAAPSWQTRPGEMGDRDLLFFDAMLAWLGAHQCVDATRVFVMGYSNGAGLANVLACERASAIAGVAAASGRLACAPASSKPAIISHGMRDQTVGYEQAIQAAQAWSQRNGCAAPPKIGTPGCFAASACASAPTMMCTHTGGHEYNSPFTRSVADFFRALPAGK